MWFVLSSTVEHALRRPDAFDYLRYAYNLVAFHTFSRSSAADGPVLPDSFRDPGYPSFLASLLLPLGFSERWYLAVLLIQALLGALTAGLTVLIARRWLHPAASIGAGALVAVWPHSVVFSGYVLSETLFGFMLTLAVWLSCRAFEADSRARWFGAGLGFGLAAMVNAVFTPAAPLLAWMFWRRRTLAPSLALALLLGSMILPAAWAVRGWSIQSDRSPEGRAAINLVQGSWPEYHDAYIGALGHNPAAQETMQRIAREQDLMLHSPMAGAVSIWGRFCAAPWRYLSWYAFKPTLLWGWSIRMGWGDIYAYEVTHSIYLSNPFMPAVEALCFALNPLLFLLMALALLMIAFRPVVAGHNPGLVVVAVLVGLETLVYSLLQAEPRYSIPFRPLQMILAATAAQGILALWLRRTRRPGGSPLAAAQPASRTSLPDSENPAPRGAN